MKKVKLGLLLGLVVVLVAAFALPGCAPEVEEVEEEEEEEEEEEVPTGPIKIGINFPLTGPKANFGTMAWNSIRMAYAYFDVTEIGGRPITFVVEDNRGDPAIAKSAFEKLAILDEVDIVLGGYTSACGITQAAAANDLKVPFITNTASKEAITASGYEWVFSGARSPACHYTDAMWSFVDEALIPGGIQKVALFYEMTDWGTTSAKTLRAMFEARGVELVYDEPYDSDAIDHKPMLAAVKAAEPDMIMAVSYLMDASLIARQMGELRLDVLCFMGQAGGYTMPDFAINAGENVNYVLTTTLWSPLATWEGEFAGVKWVNQDYFEGYQKSYRVDPDYHGANGFAQWMVPLDALLRIDAAGETINRETIKEALKETKLMTPMGLIEHLDWCDEYGYCYTNQCEPTTYVVQWQNLVQQVVWPLEAKSADYIFPVPKWEER